jgi:hypothetical protein
MGPALDLTAAIGLKEDAGSWSFFYEVLYA